MTEEERKFLADLPELITVYRGYQPLTGNEDGMSWTLDRDVAQRLGNRWWTTAVDDKPLTDPLNRGQVQERVIQKSEIFAYLGGRKESEVIILPENTTKGAA
jgi:hypothetical protein